MEFKLFNTTIPIDEYGCKINGCPAQKYEEHGTMLTVVLTNTCNYKCKFCCNPNVTCKGDVFDIEKFYEVLHEITSNTKLLKVNITGGEPTKYPTRLNDVIKAIRTYSKDTWIGVNTNGMNLNDIDIYNIDNISLSCHSYDETKNETSVTDKLLDLFKHKDKVHISCNLMKGKIDSEEKIIKLLEYVDSYGYNDVGFVSLMKVNEFCENAYVDFRDIEFTNPAIKLYCQKDYKVPNVCTCRNYAYISNKGNIIKFYNRQTLDKNYHRGTRVYYVVDGLYKWYGGLKIK